MDKLKTLPNYTPSKLQLDRIVADCVVPFWQFDMAPARDLLLENDITDLGALREHIDADSKFIERLSNTYVVPIINGAGLELLQAESLEELNEVMFNAKILNHQALNYTEVGHPLETQVSSFGQRFDGVFEAAKTGLERVAALIFVAMQGESRVELHVKAVGVHGRPMNLLLHCFVPEEGGMVDMIGRDITEEIEEHKRLEGHYKEKVELVESFSDIVCTLDENAELDYVSPSIESLLGWSPEEFIRHSKARTLTSDIADIGKIVLDDLHIARSTPAYVDNFRKQLKIDGLCKSGKTIPLSLNFSL